MNRDNGNALAGGADALARASVLFPGAVFGPLANLLLRAFAERGYFPPKLPLAYGLNYWHRKFEPCGNARLALGTSTSAVALPAG